MPPVKSKDAKFLKTWRTSNNLSQLELAELLGVAENTVARWERGEMAVPKYLKLALAGLEVELDKEKE